MSMSTLAGLSLGKALALAGLVAVAAFSTGFWAGYAWEHARLSAQLERERRERAEERSEVARRELARREDERERLDAALAERERQRLALDATNRRLRDELRRTTSVARPCLSDATRSLLEQAPAFGSRLPGTTIGAARPDAAVAADREPEDRGQRTEDRGQRTEDRGQRAEDRAVSEAEVAQWMLEAADLYEQCRQRIDALRAWAEVNRDGR